MVVGKRSISWCLLAFVLFIGVAGGCTGWDGGGYQHQERGGDGGGY